MTALVQRTDDSGVATLSLNRPEALNALSPALFVELRAHLEAIAATPDAIGCVILLGEGRVEVLPEHHDRNEEHA